MKGACSWAFAMLLLLAGNAHAIFAQVAYTITVTATDYACNVTTATAKVLVPHDQRDKSGQ